jgi:hypothetical protein
MSNPEHLKQLLREKAAVRQARAQGLPDPPPEPKRTALPCVHEGNVLERCHTCGGEARHVRECDLHGKCTRGFVSNKVQSCSRCPDYKPDPDS